MDLRKNIRAEEVNECLRHSSRLVVTAPPGAGKSTVLPITILEGLQGTGKILMLEPRRIAARQVASRMAQTLGESVGQTVGYRVRFESRVGHLTRIEVLTEGILTRMLASDPTLDGVDAVIFDEFHERSLQSDVALALTRESQALVRPDLKIIIMSATIDAAAICRSLDAPLIEAGGRMYPVEVIHSPVSADEEHICEEVVRTVRRALSTSEGDILAFLPGEAQIRRCEEALANENRARIRPLYGMMSLEEQQKAIAPCPEGERKVVLATPIAETSLTIEGVRTVVDSGFCRRMVYDSGRGLSRLETIRISHDMATQRTGRAGRVAPGVCYRLWSLGTDAQLAATRTPEILDADLSPTVLDIAAWGSSRPEGLPWLTPPPPGNLARAKTLLKSLGAIDDGGEITPAGRRMAALPCHPRIARMLLSADSPSLKSLACDLAAILEDKDFLPTAGADISLRVNALRQGRGGRATHRTAASYRDLTHSRKDTDRPDPFACGFLLASAFPEWVARAGGVGGFSLACGESASLDSSDPISDCEWIAVAGMQGRSGSLGRILLAAPLDKSDLEALVHSRERFEWDSRQGRLVARSEDCIGSLVLRSRPLDFGADPSLRQKAVEHICRAVTRQGVSMLDFSDEVTSLQRRIAWISARRPELNLPDLSTESLLRTAPDWLPPFIGRATTVQELKKIDLAKALLSLLTYGQQSEVDSLAPRHLTVPTGSRIRLEYRTGSDLPVLRVRLQECLGLTDTPMVDDGRCPVLMELLSPGYKPVQLTRDLRNFWKNTYFEVRSELRRRYPKHYWPDNPLEAEPTRGVKRNTHD